MSRPLVGVTTSEVRRAERTQPLDEGEPPQHEMALGMPYVRALARAGAVPVVLPPLPADAVPALLAPLSAVCLSGGPDLDPSAYGASPSPDLGPVEPALDLFELEVARVADAAGLPIFGICRGAQALNVARGGTLHQHLPAVTDHSIDHRQTAPGWEETHQVRVDPNSRLAAILGGDAAWVNSFHHQAVDRLGAGLRAVAWAPDGTVEGIEDPDRFVLGVQWHAETLDRGGPHHRLFEALVAAAQGDRLDLAA
jgi:putative glutamine amidotransferase